MDHRFDFRDNISNTCKTTNKKLHVLSIVSAIMNSDKYDMLINSFIKSHFCRKTMNKFNKAEKN